MKKMLEYQADRIEAVLSLNKVPARVTGGTVTPRWVRFSVQPELGAKIGYIKRLDEEIAAALDANNCRVSRRGAVVDIEIPRDDPQPVRLLPLYRQLVESNDKPVPPATAILGLADDGAPLMIRLPSPDVAHILVSGTTGSGKTVLLQTMIASLAMFNRPRDLALVLVDPKAHAFRVFSRLPHLARPVVTDIQETIETLYSLVRLMERRGVKSTGDPTVILLIDELADILLVGGKPVELALTRLTQRGREAGIHIVAATQKPTAEVLGPLVKANFPVRLTGRVASVEDARVATGWSGTGAERLTGRGDFLAIAEGRAIRFQAAHISRDEIQDIVAGVGGPSAHIELPVVEVENEPDDDEALARLLVESDLWAGRHNESGEYRWGFLSIVCKMLFDQPLAGAFHARTNDVLAIAESISTAGLTAEPVEQISSTTKKVNDTVVEIENKPVSGSSRRISSAQGQFKPFYSDAPATCKLNPIATATTDPINSALNQALLIGVTLGFGIGYCVKTLIDLIGGLL